MLPERILKIGLMVSLSLGPLEGRRTGGPITTEGLMVVSANEGYFTSIRTQIFVKGSKRENIPSSHPEISIPSDQKPSY